MEGVIMLWIVASFIIVCAVFCLAWLVDQLGLWLDWCHYQRDEARYRTARRKSRSMSDDELWAALHANMYDTSYYKIGGTD
jgi:hypothetical protein